MRKTDFKFRAWFPFAVRRGNEWTGQMITGMSNSEIFRLAGGDGYKLMQSTGRFDVKNIEIFEGDITNHGIVEWFDNLSWDSGGSDHPGFYFRPNYKTDEPEDLRYHTSFDNCEVLGNIYENPELLQNATP